jgi:ubiquitin carboxyl-terminal hydrolase 4/11/15
MNSALQCLSNVPALTTYFLSDEYKEHINHNNPLGMKGDVATAYGQLLQEMWSGTTDYYAPKLLKQSVAKYAPQFSGFSQQDSQEFMSFLLDGLHEDLNQIKIKPYVEKKDDDGTTDDDQLARDQWEDYLKRNQSKIQDIFHGQIKSLVQCLICQTQGRTFDPICFLSLSLPFKAKIRTFKIEYVRLNGQIKTYRIKCNEEGHMCNLVRKFCDGFQEKKKDTRENDQEEEEEEEGEDFTKDDDYDGHKPKPNCILPVEVFNHRIHLQYRNDSALNNIFKNDQIIFYEIPDPSKEENKEKISIPCIFRDDYFQYNFGLPIYISVPTNNCKGSDIQEALEVNKTETIFIRYLSHVDF